MNYPTLKELKNLKGARVIVRVDFNVPLDAKGKIEDTFRIDSALPTLEYLRNKGARVILVSHIGKDGATSLKVVHAYLNKKFPLAFSKDVVGSEVEKQVYAMKAGDAILLENVRKEVGEMGNSKIFALELAKLGEAYVNEAFSVAHRAHASLVLIPKLLPSYMGFQCEKEVKELSKVHDNVKHPFLFILGGAKFETKIPLIKTFLKTADTVFVGGALANNFLKLEGYNVGKSLIDEDVKGLEKIAKNKKLLLPVDLIVENGKTKKEIGLDEVKHGDIIVDMGKASVALLETYIKKAKMIVWNGPLGKGANTKATSAILHLLAQSKATRIIGGGDTAEIIDELKLKDKVGFVSTGGGAAIDFLIDEKLPALEAIAKKQS